jgi:hypothetical protein
MSKPANRMPLIDALKAIAALLVLLNHFSSYGPLAEAARDAFPAISGWIFEYCRMAVQVFLVIAGFLAARGLSAEGQALSVSPLPLIWKRYLRLAVPYLAAIGLAIIASAIANQWLDDEAIPARATFVQWLAHAALLHSLLGFDSLSAGVWYIAIDFQLFALMATLLWLGRRNIVAPALVLGMTIASLFWFNRDASWDNWAIYFFGSYGLGLPPGGPPVAANCLPGWGDPDHRHGCTGRRFPPAHRAGPCNRLVTGVQPPYRPAGNLAGLQAVSLSWPDILFALSGALPGLAAGQLRLCPAGFVFSTFSRFRTDADDGNQHCRSHAFLPMDRRPRGQPAHHGGAGPALDGVGFHRATGCKAGPSRHPRQSLSGLSWRVPDAPGSIPMPPDSPRLQYS